MNYKELFMQYNNKHDEGIIAQFSKDELYMLRMATNGPVFQGTKNRDIPTSVNWEKQEALDFEKRIRDAYENFSGSTSEINLTQKELAYLTKIHGEHMEEMDPIEYPTIVGYSWEEAQQLLNELQEAVSQL